MTPEIAIGLVTALGLGALVGLERQWRQRSSGMATHAMVALGAASFSILPLLLDNEVSVTRMAAQVVSGIGFLGAGVIMRDGLSVRGLSTAASIWSTGAIGVLAGSGFILAACMTTALIVIANLFLPALGRVVDRHTSGEAEQERFYQISVSCEARNEALVRMQLLQRMGDNRLNPEPGKPRAERQRQRGSERRGVHPAQGGLAGGTDGRQAVPGTAGHRRQLGDESRRGMNRRI